jgi:hypothetical protein
MKFVFVGPDPETVVLPDFLENIPPEDVSAIAVSSGDIPHVQFYEYDEKNNKFKKAYSGLPDGRPPYIPTMHERDVMLYAAMFAENSEYYRCSIKKALIRLPLVIEVYEQRTQELSDFYQGTETCELYYPAGGYNVFDQLISSTEECLGNLQSYECSQIFQHANTLESENDNVKGKGCPLIY